MADDGVHARVVAVVAAAAVGRLVGEDAAERRRVDLRRRRRRTPARSGAARGAARAAVGAARACAARRSSLDAAPTALGSTRARSATVVPPAPAARVVVGEVVAGVGGRAAAPAARQAQRDGVALAVPDERLDAVEARGAPARARDPAAASAAAAGRGRRACPRPCRRRRR